MTKKTYKVQGMDCPSCAMVIESDLEEIEMNTKKKIKPLVEVSLTSDELKKIYQDLFKDWTIKVLRKDPYIEHYEENFKGIEWKCNFMVIVAKKN